MIVLAVGCHRRSPDCEYDSVERCLWERGGQSAESGEAGLGGGGAGDPEGGEAPADRWSAVGSAIEGLAELVGAGLEWGLVDAQARELCGEFPVESGDGSGAWTCALAQALELEGRPFVLEVGVGVVALTAEGVSDDDSVKLVAAASATTLGGCEAGFADVEGPVNQEFQVCNLRSGPLLYIGRFPQDLDTNRWQVSIAVVDAG